DLRLADLLELLPEVGAAGLVLAEPVQAAERKAEELEAFEAAAHRGLAVAMAREARHHADVRVHGVADRHALLALDDRVVLVHPGPRLGRIDERERQRADTEARGHLDGLALRAGD